MNLDKLREENRVRKLSGLPLAGVEVGQRSPVTIPQPTPQPTAASAAAPTTPSQAALAQQLGLPQTIFGIPFKTFVKISLSLMVAGGILGLIVKFKALCGGGNK